MFLSLSLIIFFQLITEETLSCFYLQENCVILKRTEITKQREIKRIYIKVPLNNSRYKVFLISELQEDTIFVIYRKRRGLCSCLDVCWELSLPAW